jgi:hypothetical protein
MPRSGQSLSFELSDKALLHDVPTPRDRPHRASQSLGGLLLTQVKVPDQIEEFPVFVIKGVSYLVKPCPRAHTFRVGIHWVFGCIAPKYLLPINVAKICLMVSGKRLGAGIASGEVNEFPSHLCGYQVQQMPSVSRDHGVEGPRQTQGRTLYHVVRLVPSTHLWEPACHAVRHGPHVVYCGCDERISGRKPRRLIRR